MATRWLALWLWLVTLLASVGASAQSASRPADLLEAAAVPALPEGWTEVHEGQTTWQAAPEARELLETLRQTTLADRQRVLADLAQEEAPLLVRLGRNPDEMAELAPPDAPPPPYAVGVTYPGLALVVLTATAPTTWEPAPLDRVLVHEWTHFYLHRAIGDNTVPLWFDEGLAIHEARERNVDRVRTLWEATVRDTLISLDDLSRRFPAQPRGVSLAYAESADFVGWLFQHGDGGAREVPRLIGRLRRGDRFEVAISQTYSAGIGQLEVDWRADLARRYAAMPLLLGSSFAWLVVLVLLVLAYRRKRKDQGKILARWEAEEAREEIARALAARAALEAARHADDAAEEAAIDAEEQPTSSVPPPALRDDGVPRVTHEGRQHTLH